MVAGILRSCLLGTSKELKMETKERIEQIAKEKYEIWLATKFERITSPYKEQ